MSGHLDAVPKYHICSRVVDQEDNTFIDSWRTPMDVSFEVTEILIDQYLSPKKHRMLLKHQEERHSCILILYKN